MDEEIALRHLMIPVLDQPCPASAWLFLATEFFFRPQSGRDLLLA
jgi:hypothetical protein